MTKRGIEAHHRAQMAHGALANINTDEIIARIAAGAYQSHIARELGVAPQSLHAKIRTHPAYREALEARNMAKLDQAQNGLEDAAADVARAREQFKAAAWRAERECPQLWGQRQHVEHSGSVAGPSFTVVVAQQSDSVRITDVMLSASTQHPQHDAPAIDAEAQRVEDSA